MVRYGNRVRTKVRIFILPNAYSSLVCIASVKVPEREITGLFRVLQYAVNHGCQVNLAVELVGLLLN